MSARDQWSVRQDPMQVAIRMSHNLIRPGIAGVVWALVELTSAAVKNEENPKRLPLNVGLVLDRSGSMTGKPLEYVKNAAAFVVEQVGAGDRFSLVTFDDQVNVLCPAGHVTNKDYLKSLIGAIQPGGSTNLSGGFLRGCREVLGEARPGRVNRVILLTDGQANVGITEPSVLSAKARSMAEKGISITSIGVGEDFNEDLLIAMSEAGRGNYYYIKNPDEIPGVFAEELQGLLKVVAQGIRVTVTGGPGCKVIGVLGYEPAMVPEGVTVDLPDMYENETKVLVLELAHPPFLPGDHEILRVGVDYSDSLGNLEAVSLGIGVTLPVGDGPAELYKPNIEVIKVVELTRTALAKDKAVDAIDRDDFDEGRKVLEERLHALDQLQQAFGQPDPEISREVKELKDLVARFTPSPAAPCGDVVRESSIRKDLRYQSYQRRRRHRT
ncbi:MAG TPA: VWA domain-containing protein [Clostridia bacterium]|nr:VWA domain-containing protein [Clostridia bacterium]